MTKKSPANGVIQHFNKITLKEKAVPSRKGLCNVTGLTNKPSSTCVNVYAVSTVLSGGRAGAGTTGHTLM